MDAVRVPKGTARVIQEARRVALYYPQRAAPLGRPILYDVQLFPEAFEKVGRSFSLGVGCLYVFF